MPSGAVNIYRKQKYYKDMTVAEIAEVLDKPEGTVKTWLNKGLKQLRDKMKRKGDLDHG